MRKLLLMLAALGLLASAPAAPAAEPGDAAAGEDAVLKKERYDYSSGGRRDPFLSIIESAKKAREKKRPKGLVPLEDYDLSQVNLIAIVWDEEMYRALVGLPNGKYYTLREGTSVGLHGGKVVRIARDRLVVREYIRDYKGNLRPEDTVLRLRKEEGE